jgi:hypothetical protein
MSIAMQVTVAKTASSKRPRKIQGTTTEMAATRIMDGMMEEIE